MDGVGWNKLMDILKQAEVFEVKRLTQNAYVIFSYKNFLTKISEEEQMVKKQNLCFKGIKTVTCHCEKLSEEALNDSQGIVIIGYNLTVVRYE